MEPIRIGNVFRAEITNEEYVIVKVIDDWVLLKGKGLRQVFTSIENLNRFYQRKEKNENL